MFKTLDRVPIFVLGEHPTPEDIEKIEETLFKDVKDRVTFVKSSQSLYSKTFGKGGYVTEPLFDDNMNLSGRVGYIYVSRISENDKLKDKYSTTINLDHLIHELGHAEACEIGEYEQLEDGTLISKIGVSTEISKIDRKSRTVYSGELENILIEEALNTIEQERVLLDMLQVDNVEDINGYIPSNYQGYICDVVSSYVERFGNDCFNRYRLNKDREALKEVEERIKKTDAWQELQKEDYTKRKKEKFKKIQDLDVSDRAKELIQGTISEYEDVYFPDNSKFSPLQKVNNVLEQVYDLKDVKYNFGIVGNEKNYDIFKEIMTSILAEAYVIKNQVKDISDNRGILSELKEQVVTSDEDYKRNIEDNNKKVKNKKRKNKIYNKSKIGYWYII